MPETLRRLGFGLTPSRKISVTELKRYSSGLPTDSALRQILALERDEIAVEEFLARLPIWLALSGRSLEE